MTIQHWLKQDQIDRRPLCGDDIWKVADFLEIQSIVGRDRAENLAAQLCYASRSGFDRRSCRGL